MPALGAIDRGSRGLPFTGAYLFAMLLLYVGERLVFEHTGARVAMAAIAAIAIVIAFVGRAARMRQVGDAARLVERRVLLCYAFGLLALALYLCQADFVMERLRPLFAEPRAAEHYEGALAVLWVVVLVCALVPLAFIELSYAPMDTTRTVDSSRIRSSMQSGLILAMSGALVFVLNFMADEYNEKVDLSYFKTTRASESSKKMVGNLTEDFNVTLFFPSANEVLDRVLPFFEELKNSSDHFKMKVADHVLEPKLAKELGASDNGTIVFSRKKKTHTLSLGTKLNRAKSKLKKLDSEFQNAFLKLARNRKVVYFTVGHEERAQDQTDRPRTEQIRDLRSALRKLNYTVKDLGMAQGLASAIPTDATFVLISGPRKKFLPEEITVLKKYLRNGGRAMIFLDPEAGITLNGLLGPFGLKYTATPLAVQAPLARRTFTKADRHIIVTNRFGSHTSVSTLSRHSNQLAVVMMGAGYLEEIPSTDNEHPKVHLTVHSMPSTWDDGNGNFEFDRNTEKRKVYELAAAVTLKPEQTAKTKAKGSDNNEMRMVVVADADIISDGLLFSRAVGNRYLLLDAVKWLGGEEKFIGETTSEEDIRIAHTRKEDQLWFYLTIFGVPAIVLGAGLFQTRRRRKR